jgi:hypothetical protein
MSLKMNIAELLSDKTKKIKVKTETISKWLLDGELEPVELMTFAKKANDVEKATCIEAIEYATKINSEIVTLKLFEFTVELLTNSAPRVKWESARVIGNVAHLFPSKLQKAITNLLTNAEDKGTVIRCASAFALSEILKLKTKHNKDLLPAIEALYNNEQDNAIRKKYFEAMKKINK